MPPDALDKTLEPEKLDHLEAGPNGFQREPGFRIVRDSPEYPGGYAVILVPLVLCASDAHPAPQPRFLSPHEMARGRLEVADRLVAVRVLGTPIIGRRDDVEEIARGKVHSHIMGFIGKALGFLVGRLTTLPGLLDAALGKVTGGGQ